MKRAVLGLALLVVGLTIISPVEEVLILIPMSAYFNMPELIIAFNALAIVSLIGAVFFLGTSKVTGQFKQHWKMATISVIILVIALYWYLGG